MMNRRAFLKFLVSIPVVAALPPLVKLRERLTLEKLVTKTLRQNRAKLANNILSHNALIQTLNRDKAKTRVYYTGRDVDPA